MKPPQKGAASTSCLCFVAGLRLGRLQVPSRFLARSAVRLDIVGYLLALGQAMQPRALERAGMDEDVLAAAVRLNKAITFGCVVPFDGACCHNVLLPLLSMRRMWFRSVRVDVWGSPCVWTAMRNSPVVSPISMPF